MLVSSDLLDCSQVSVPFLVVFQGVPPDPGVQGPAVPKRRYVSVFVTDFDRDAFTTTSDFIISPHSACDGLYLATCGNFHGWKFFPVLGKYVLKMLEGELESDLVEKWAWDRERPDASKNPEFPRAEMHDLGERPLRAKL